MPNPDDDMEMRIRAFIADNLMMGQDSSALSREDSLLDKGIIDSTGVLELVGFLEDTFDIQVEDEEMIPANLDSIVSLIPFIRGKQTAAGV